MPFDISKYAKGLPAILGLKERGRGIPVLSDILNATADIRDLYLLEGRETVNLTNIAAPAVGLNVFPEIVPVGELWYIWSLAIAATPGAGAAIDMTVSAFLENLGTWNPREFVAAAATQHIRQTTVLPFWAGPGSTFGAAVRSVTLAPPISGSIVATKLRV
jgi:hypothetical protein